MNDQLSNKPSWNTEITYLTKIVRIDPAEWRQAMGILPERKWSERLSPDIDDVLDEQCRDGWRLIAMCFIPGVGVLLTIAKEHTEKDGAA
jgi:hypothetical protein